MSAQISLVCQVCASFCKEELDVYQVVSLKSWYIRSNQCGPSALEFLCACLSRLPFRITTISLDAHSSSTSRSGPHPDGQTSTTITFCLSTITTDSDEPRRGSPQTAQFWRAERSPILVQGRQGQGPQGCSLHPVPCHPHGPPRQLQGMCVGTRIWERRSTVMFC